MSFRLFHNAVALIADEVAETTASGLIVAESAQSPLRYGTVTHVGSGDRSPYTGEIVVTDLAVGARVFFSRFSGQTLRIEDVDYLVLGFNEIAGIVD